MSDCTAEVINSVITVILKLSLTGNYGGDILWYFHDISFAFL